MNGWFSQFRFQFLVLSLASLGQFYGICAAEKSTPDLPNIVVIFIDDMGYADIGPFGATDYPTPNLDRMASEGRIFTDFHSATAVCSASRAALLTGCYPERVSIRRSVVSRRKVRAQSRGTHNG